MTNSSVKIIIFQRLSFRKSNQTNLTQKHILISTWRISIHLDIIIGELLRALSIIAGAPSKQWSDETVLQEFFFWKVLFFENILENLFSEIFQKSLVPEEEFLTSGSTQELLSEEHYPECFRKISIYFRKNRKFSFFFLKNILFCNNLLLIG